MVVGETQLRDASGVSALIAELSRKIRDGAKSGLSLALVGIRSRGVPTAERLAAEIGRLTGQTIPVGAIDITLYRDDLGRGNRWPVLKGTEIPFGVDGIEIVLVDDVLFTGRTVRAAIDCVCDLGRPSSIHLAVLVDRGGRELPIQADYVGMTIDVAEGERVRVRLSPIDSADEVVLVPVPTA